MKSLKWAATLIMCMACKSDNEPLPDDKPRITALRIDGIDSKSISIDQIKNLVEVLLPSGFSKEKLNINTKLSKGAFLLPRKFGNQINLFSCQAEDSLLLVSQNNPISSDDTTRYSMKFIQSDPIEISMPDLPEQRKYIIAGQDYFAVDVKNFIDGSQPAEVHLSNQIDKSAPEVVVRCCMLGKPADDIIYSVEKLRFRISREHQVTPNPYTVSIIKPNGRRAVASQPLSFTKGPILLNDRDYLNQRSINGGKVKTFGFNLFESSDIAIQLIDTKGIKHRTQITNFSPFGSEITFDPGNALKPGYYTLQVLENGKVASYYDGRKTYQNYRFSVTTTVKQPFIKLLGDLSSQEFADVYSSPARPLVVTKSDNQTVPMTYLVIGLAHIDWTKHKFYAELTPVGQSEKIIQVPFFVDGYELYDDRIEAQISTLFAFSNTPPGRYLFHVVVSNPQTGEINKSEPFERIIEIP